MRQITLEDIRTMAEDARGEIDRIFLHWSAGHYGQPFKDYHINIDRDGELYSDVLELTEVLPHTWHQNAGAIGVSILCCAFATTEDFGKEPPTTTQVETMAQVVAVVCTGLDLPCDIEHVRTHAEQADLDDYGPATTCERWDLWFLPGTEKGEGGNLIRGKAIWYQQNGVNV